jgi:hypothetical protein
MSDYKVEFKTNADEGYQRWLLGPFQNGNQALAFFNIMHAAKEGLGQFAFQAADGPIDPHYSLVESEPSQGETGRWPIAAV